MAHHVPMAGAVLSLIGGLFVLAVGGWIANVAPYFAGFLGPFTALFFIGAVVGLLIVFCSVLLLVAPRMKTAWGALIIGLAFASLPFALGGLGFGFLLALIGGILAITYRPPPPMPSPVPRPSVGQPGWPPPMERPSATACPHCRAVVDLRTRACTGCGRSV